MNTKTFWMLTLVLMIAVSSYSGEATQMWRCEMDDDATEEDVHAMAASWLKAAKKMKGGENLQAYVFFPVAVNATGEIDLLFVVTAPSFAEWGKFWDGYLESAAAIVDKEHEDKVICPDSSLWESIKIK